MADKILKSITFPKLPDKYIIPETVVDPVPTQGSSSAVSSGGVYTEFTGLKEDLDSISEDIFKEVSTVTTGTYTTTAGTGIVATTHLVDVDIASGTVYKFKLTANGISSYALYANGSNIATNRVTGTEYSFTASTNITYLSIYVNGTAVTASETITGTVTVMTETENSLEERIETLENNAVTVDSTPTENSSKAVSSGSAYILQEDIEALNAVVLPETSDKNIGYITCVSGTGVVATNSVVAVDIPEGDAYTIEFEDPDGCISTSGTINVYENEANASVGTVTYTASANETQARTATKDIGWISVYITGANVVASGTVKVIVKSNISTNANSLVTKTNALTTFASGAKSTIYDAVVTAKHTKTIDISSYYIHASTHVFNVAISQWDYFSFEADFTADSYAIYVNGSALFTELEPNTKYYFQATTDITYLSIYSNTITSDSIDFTLELIDYNSANGVNYSVQSIEEIKSGYVSIPHMLLVGCYLPSGSGSHSAAINEYHTNLIAVSPGDQIDIALTYEDATQTARLTAMLYDSSKAIVGRANVTLSAVGKYKGTYTIPAGVYYVSFQPALYAGGTFAISQKLDIDGLALPPYYNANDYIQNKIRTIASTIANAYGDYDVFIFNTDQHWKLNAKNSPRLIHYICDCIPIKKLFLGGDLNDGIDLQASKAFADAFNGDVYELIGNHEYMNYVFDLNGSGLYTDVTDALICAYYGTGLSNIVYGSAERQYYYVDDESRKMRYIVLSVFTDNGSSAKYYFETAQQTWFANTALNLPSGYTAVILTHALYTVEYGTGTLTIPDETVLQPLIDIINNYSGSGQIACVFVGHAHLDGMMMLDSGVPVFVTTCDKCDPYVYNDEDMEPWLTESRTKGTITEQAFDVVVIDKRNTLVSAIRIGAPAYNGGDTELEIRTASYGNL